MEFVVFGMNLKMSVIIQNFSKKKTQKDSYFKMLVIFHIPFCLVYSLSYTDIIVICVCMLIHTNAYDVYINIYKKHLQQ